MITQSTYETDKAKLLFVEVPEGARDFVPLDDTMFNHLIWNQYDLPPKRGYAIIPDGDWIIAGLLHEVQEEVAAKLVDYKNIVSPCACEYCGYDLDCYRDYEHQTDQDWAKYPSADCVSRATESLQSLARHLRFTDKQNVLVLFTIKK